MNVPFKMKEFVSDSFKFLVEAFRLIFLFATILPLVFYTVYAIAREKETGF